MSNRILSAVVAATVLGVAPASADTITLRVLGQPSGSGLIAHQKERPDRITVAAGDQGAPFMVLGGATFSEPRYIWWNFVASSRERIEEAKAEWRAESWGKGRFDLPIEDRDEYIPLPG